MIKLYKNVIFFRKKLHFTPSVDLIFCKDVSSIHTLQKEFFMTVLKKIETSKAPQAIGPYSQAVCANSMVFVSGQLPLNPDSGKLVEADIYKQVNCVLDNLAAILEASGCSFKDVVRCDVFLKDLNDFAIMNQECAKRFTQPIPPARQTIQVARLPLDALIEISCIAIRS